jgi:hypothetical protein
MNQVYCRKFLKQAENFKAQVIGPEYQPVVEI